MRKHRLQFIVASMAMGLSVLSSATQPTKTSDDALVAALLWGEYGGLDLSAYPPEVRADLERARQRFEAYQSTRRRPINSSEAEMLHAVMVRYERLLVAPTAERNAPALAVEYVNELRPCYEWEGYHDCPEHEALFAMEYLAANPNSPFKEYLPLLAADRWLCAASGYDYEKRPKDAARSRRAAEAAIRMARQSNALIVRVAAETLRARGRCRFPA